MVHVREYIQECLKKGVNLKVIEKEVLIDARVALYDGIDRDPECIMAVQHATVKRPLFLVRATYVLRVCRSTPASTDL